jgi:CheY-like chemotaxis protein
MKKTVKVLVVEDMRAMRLLLKGLLPSAMGDREFTILEATDGEEGLRMAREHRPDLVISDVEMPRMTGVQMCRALKTDGALVRTPVVLVTSKSSQRQAGLDAGASAFMSKPIRTEELETVLKSILDASTRANPLPVYSAGSESAFATASTRH